MDRIKLMLNTRKPGNYAFFCPKSKLHLTLSNPIGFVDGVTPSILVGVKTKTLIDVDGVIDLGTGLTNNVNNNTKEASNPIEAPNKVNEDINKANTEKSPVEPTEEVNKASSEEPKKRGRKKNTEVTE